ncbi:RNA-binding protein NOB1 [Periophthalmus magnuspinnatus]|uniref:RNA-binding protein NOB1 n=1 Tax=Periophthalmus magnuspinnatus TaxID=409849 RepID=UPI00145BDF32|nr:RNA-binding protein NOB1 [Periophthalmus magnuspinnatus]
MAPCLVEHVVADAGAFLKKAPLQEIGKNIYTLKDVVEEIRDKPTRRSLAFLPYELKFKDPLPEHIRTVTEFSKRTGDYASLSATDIKVLALTYQLELEHVGSQHLKKEPDVKVNIQSTKRHPETPVNVAGFHFPSKKPNSSKNTPSHTRTNSCSEPQTETEQNEEFNSFHFWREPLPLLNDDLLSLLEPVIEDTTETKPEKKPTEKPTESKNKTSTTTNCEEFNSFYFWREPAPLFDEDLLSLLSDSGVSESKQDSTLSEDSDEDKENEPQEEEEQEEDEEDQDGGGWITPSNIKQVKMDTGNWSQPEDVTVGCLTTDFAMQNVLIQIGLHVLSVNGMVIKQARNYILRCHACFKTTTHMERVFCPHCGNKTLKKLAVTVNEDGSIQMHFSRNPKVLNPKGLRYSLPLPQGGKHGDNPHLVEDQRFPQQRLSRKARQKTNVFDPDYIAGSSPFSQNDIYSRAAGLNLRDSQSGAGRRRANPNAAGKKFVKK